MSSLLINTSDGGGARVCLVVFFTLERRCAALPDRFKSILLMLLLHVYAHLDCAEVSTSVLAQRIILTVTSKR